MVSWFSFSRLLLFAGFLILCVLSFALLPAAHAYASVVLGLLMMSGAFLDARHFILPLWVTLGSAAVGIIFYWNDTLSDRVIAGFVTAGILLVLYFGYLRFRKIEGIGLGDVLLGFSVGIWVEWPLIPYVFILACLLAFLFIIFRFFRGGVPHSMDAVPFGLFLCPALWLVWFCSTYFFINAAGAFHFL